MQTKEEVIKSLQENKTAYFEFPDSRDRICIDFVEGNYYDLGYIRHYDVFYGEFTTMYNDEGGWNVCSSSHFPEDEVDAAIEDYFHRVSNPGSPILNRKWTLEKIASRQHNEPRVSNPFHYYSAVHRLIHDIDFDDLQKIIQYRNQDVHYAIRSEIDGLLGQVKRAEGHVALHDCRITVLEHLIGFRHDMDVSHVVAEIKKILPEWWPKLQAFEKEFLKEMLED